MIIALDLGTQCGWAVFDGAALRANGTINLAPRRHESAGIRFIRFRQHLAELIHAYPGARVAYEEVRRHLGTDAAHIYGGLLGQLQATCIDEGCEYLGIPVAAIKRRATGKGNADKDAMIRAACERFALSDIDDNTADAIWCAVVAHEQLTV